MSGGRNMVVNYDIAHYNDDELCKILYSMAEDKDVSFFGRLQDHRPADEARDRQ
jgi:hypothetical protein